ncbi:NUDIX domain-containing protein [Sporomusa sp.]|uniref:NUDIX domain-containing protein n=1 Tax=Sporomusa sp. TaxID=2078658 RepID=UPI002B8F4C45|nr:NUDIX domain-containing protein [Sporomusa sp.]HWR43065.1 NUDIX domain-containing protein [Sporomusa sp.]
MDFVVHVSTLIEREGKILFVREKKPQAYGKYNLPGGHLELGEDVVAGAKREVNEEVGFNVEMAGFLGVYEGASDNHYINFVFYAQAKEDDVPMPLEEEILDCHWLSVADIEAMDDTVFRNAKRIRLIIREFQQGRIYPIHMLHRI